ncbi:MAG: acyl-CoA reductase [Bacteroidales bacterium]|nr:acyl-CoA reductase [Bacteroidales bacterium]
MKLEERIESFTILGKILRDVLSGKPGSFDKQLHYLIESQHKSNPWFTPENVQSAITAIANELTEENLTTWTDAYPLLKEKTDPLKAGVIMAGNIPLVGFHDFLSVLISGNKLIAKTSSKDSELIELIGNILCTINNGFMDSIEFTRGTLANFDVVIATGSNNSSRYFEYYFSKYPNIIRKNRNSIAIIEGDETDNELESLGTDIFSYFGLGCRNVSKIYIPKGYDISLMVSNWNTYSDMITHNKYANNYDFNKAVYLVNKENFYDTGYLLMREESRISSPVSVLHYEQYESQSTVKQHTELLKETIQCVVSRHHLPFGKAQSPHLWDYADGIDTIEFLLKNNFAGIL